MAKRARRHEVEDDELLGGAPPKRQPKRKFTSKPTPIAAGILAPANATPKGGNVIALHQPTKKTRFDFESQTEYEIYLELQRINKEELERQLQHMRELRDVGLVEVTPPSELPEPSASASAVVKDESAELAAYLAHHNPMGATRKIHTIEGTVVLDDGTVLKVNKRQDFLDPDEPYVPYGGFEADGQVFWLSDDRKRDRKQAEHFTRRSQNCRQELGKTTKTAYLNVATVQEYRPVPDVLWFVNHPDGKSRLRGDLNPYPPGLVPVGDELASYIQDKKEHAAKVVAFENFNVWSKRTCDNMLRAAVDPQEVRDWVCRNMQAHDWRDQAIMQGRITGKWDDLPWSYADELPKAAANDSDQVSPVQRGDPTSETTPVLLLPAPAPKGQLGTSLKHIGRPDAFDWKWPSAKQEEADDLPEREDTVIVASDGFAIRVGEIHPEHREQVAEAVSRMQPRVVQHMTEGEDIVTRLSLDLTDRRAAATLRILERRIRGDIQEMYGHLEKIVEARLLAEAYQKTGEFKVENRSEFLDQAGEGEVITPVRYRKPALLAQYWAAPKTAKPRFKSMIETSEILQMERDDQRHRERKAMKLWLADRSRVRAVERKAIAQMGARIRLRRKAGTLEVLESRSYILKKHVEEMERLESHLNQQRAMLPQERVFLQDLAAAQSPHTVRVMMWHLSQFNRRTLGKVKHAMKLGKKERKTGVSAPSTEPERPVNEPVVTMLPARTPPCDQVKEPESSLILVPKVEVYQFEGDPLIQSVRRAYIQRMRASGQWKAEEIDLADKKVFSKMVA
jgi:hypothetical protein